MSKAVDKGESGKIPEQSPKVKAKVVNYQLLGKWVVFLDDDAIAQGNDDSTIESLLGQEEDYAAAPYMFLSEEDPVLVAPAPTNDDDDDDDDDEEDMLLEARPRHGGHRSMLRALRDALDEVLVKMN
ncbi:Aste57867_21662 [Aphanomyces stellatus]|uniref:Aste57867_21662 protein n=1 Tax=Aphanomyces stellatus TaxID=120398 RepID=A0A485LI43_9STRA|nr:hypothetical protein As57867_021593 [Aphanomyces stellatus]VFT98331.1 Aste57867_21662 [Aphanomyces stellatus]